MQETITEADLKCYHCGDACETTVYANDKPFCCEGCKQVYLLLNENDLCNYYDLDKSPGLKARGRFTTGRFGYLQDEEVIRKLTRFSDGNQTHVLFSLPQMHCASCIWLLENLHRINPGILNSQTNFQRKEVFIVFDPRKVTLQQVVELLAFIGYEPYISLNDQEVKKQKKINREYIYKIGVAGFCFGNIMMLSFPEYFSSGNIGQDELKKTFSYLNLLLSLPVLLYSASGFFISAWKGLRQKWLNIDAPIALAVTMAFGRSVYEILSGTGAGFLDSMSGIVFFMLIGRWFQDKTYDAFSFDRDYKSYFPLGVTLLEEGAEHNIPVSRLKTGDSILVRNEEMVPADAILRKGDAHIDYSFVSGENTPVDRNRGELIYAGGKQVGSALELEVVTPVSQSYITQLWNNEVFHNKKNKEQSFIHPWSRYFTLVLFTIAASAAVYWWLHDPSKVLPSVTAVLLVACPCSLLLSATFTYGNMVRIFGKNKLYLKNASVIESLGRVDTIVLDKTGTITHNHSSVVAFEGGLLKDGEMGLIRSVARQSSHPLSRIIAAQLAARPGEETLPVEGFTEFSGKGLEARVGGNSVKMGSSAFISEGTASPISDTGTHVHVVVNGEHRGHFTVSNDYRQGLDGMATDLRQQGYSMHILSGDNGQERSNLELHFGNSVPMHFHQTPQDKLEYIKTLQNGGHRVLMLGDGLNDAGALRQSEVGIAVSDNTNLFSPACDAILDGTRVGDVGALLRFARRGKTITAMGFMLSILYNFVGMWFATQGQLSPMIAAILMPASSISIVLLATLSSNIIAKTGGLDI